MTDDRMYYQEDKYIWKKYCVSGHYTSSCFCLKSTKFRRLDSVSVFRWNLLSWSQSIELVPISGHQHRVRITLLLAVYRQSVCLRTNPGPAIFFGGGRATEPSRSYSFCNILSDERMSLSLMNRLRLCQVYVLHVIENSSLCIIYKSSVSTAFVKQIMPILHILCYNGSLVA
jgi:hypothetical protein